jgi:hypothetical protein
MDRFIHDQNLAHYRKVLAETTDPTKAGSGVEAHCR